MALIKKVIQVELLYDDKETRDPNNMSLADIAYEMDDGSMSGIRKTISSKELTKKQMAKELRKQGSSPEFLDCGEESLDKIGLDISLNV